MQLSTSMPSGRQHLLYERYRTTRKNSLWTTQIARAGRVATLY